MNRYGTFWRRFFAGFIDGFILGGIESVLGVFEPGNVAGWEAIAWASFSAAITLAYSVGMHARFGQTVGKMATGVLVLDVSEARKLSLWQAFLRDVGLVGIDGCSLAYGMLALAFGLGERAAIAVAVVLGGASFLWFVLEVLTMLSNDRRRALHDWIAGSVVVRTDTVFLPSKDETRA